MHVIATAGHVDHGKSALLRALTGMEPDRWEAEQRRGLTIDLGYVWMRLESGERLAFVDVPGHARFVPNMLAGVGPVPAVLFVVAADGGWMPQSAEHLAAIDALGISRGLLVVTRSDLADPAPALATARDRIGRSSLGQVPAVAVSAVTGAGLDVLRTALAGLAAGLPEADDRAPVRMWLDRAFSISGSGTVVTGTLPAGTINRGDELLLTPSLRPVRVRGLQSLGEPAAALSGVARAAVNLRGVERSAVRRGMALVRPGEWTLARQADVRLAGRFEAERFEAERFETGRAQAGRSPAGRAGAGASSLPAQVTVHVGSARTPARVRDLGAGLVRLAFRDPLPLHAGDRLLVRDPGAAAPSGVARTRIDSGGVARAGIDSTGIERAGIDNAGIDSAGIWGGIVLDLDPPPPRRRGAAAAAAAELSGWPDRPAAAVLLRRRGLMPAAELRALGVSDGPDPVAAGWLADPQHWAGLGRTLTTLTGEHAARNPLSPGLPPEVAKDALRLPDRRLVIALALATKEIAVTEGRLTLAATPDQLPAGLGAAVSALLADLADRPFDAPEAARLAELGLGHRDLAAAARHGALLRLADQVVLGPGAAEQAAAILAGLDQPFTTSQARVALGSTRRTVIPLLEHLDRRRITQRLPDDRRRVRP